MNAPIVYENVNGKYEGTLFGGVKFWVHLRVPMRNTLIDMIQNNGGKIVQLEKFADISIADHIKRDAPYGSVSWKYVQDSVKEGKLLDISDYKKTSGPAQRPVGSTQPVKGTKSLFTPEEDQLLVNWVVKQEHQGEKPSGNKIYQQFAENHTSHSWQSWRDRWVRRLSLLPRKDFPRGQSSEEEPAKEGSPKVEKRPFKIQTRSTPPPVPKPKPEELSPESTRGGRQKFTEEDDRILRKWIAKCRSRGEALNGNTIYKTLAEKYPSHTYHSWRDRWVRHLSKTQEDMSHPAQNSDEAEHPLKVAEAEPKRQQPRNKEAKIPQAMQHERPMSTVGPPRPPSRQTTPVQNLNIPQSVSARRRELDERKMRIRSAREIQRVWRGWHVRRELSHAFMDLESLLPHAKGYLVRRNTAKALNEIKAEDEDAVPLDSIQPYQAEDLEPPAEALVNKEEFITHLYAYYKFKGVNPISSVEIMGTNVDLWDLWRATIESHETPDYRDWEDIATSIGFDWIKIKGAPNQLKSAFDQYLGEFEEVFNCWAGHETSEDEDHDQEHDHGQDQVQEQEQDQDLDPDDFEVKDSSVNPKPNPTKRRLDFDSSPPTGIKRGLGQATSSSLAELSSPRKRRRYDPDEEIPETPKRTQEADQPASLPTQDYGSTEATQAMMKSSPWRLPRLPAGNKQPLEPETQDFRFGQVFDGEEDEITSSQQLQLEAALAFTLPQPRTINPPELRAANRMPRAVSISSSDSSEGFATPIKSFSIVKTSASSVNSKATRRSLPASWSKKTAPLHPAVQGSARTPQGLNGCSVGSKHRVSESALVSPTKRSKRAHSSSGPPGSLACESSMEAVRAAIERFISLGYHPSVVITALKATTLVVSEAGPVMERLSTGSGIPENVPGVWTATDDAGLQMVDQTNFGETKSLEAITRMHRARKEKLRLLDKHGAERMQARRDFLLEMSHDK